MLWEQVAQLAFAALVRPGRSTQGIFHTLAVRAASLVAAMVLGILAVVCAAAGALIMWAPPLAAPQILFILSATLVFIALVTWLVMCKGKGPHQMVAEALEAPTSPFDDINRKVERVTHAFNRGWNAL